MSRYSHGRLKRKKVSYILLTLFLQPTFKSTGYGVGAWFTWPTPGRHSLFIRSFIYSIMRSYIHLSNKTLRIDKKKKTNLKRERFHKQNHTKLQRYCNVIHLWKLNNNTWLRRVNNWLFPFFDKECLIYQ